jgi:hypothetical protein
VKDVNSVGFVDVMEDEAGGDIALGERDDVIEGEGVAVAHFIVERGRDAVGAEDIAVALIDGFASGEENGDEDQR